MIKEHDCVVLTEDLPEEGFKAGDIGTVVTLMASQVCPFARRDLAHVRELQTV